jgi:SAM-dependent methyltransferase
VSFYGEDLAYVHDAGFGKVAAAGAHELAALLAIRGRAGGAVVELGVGSAISTRVLLDAGYHLAEFDVSKDMLALARARAPEAILRHGALLDVSPPPCVAVTAFGEAMNYFDAEPPRARAVSALFRRVHDALEPRGVFLFDLAGPGAAARRGWTLGADWAVMHESTIVGAILTRRIVAFRSLGNAYRRSEEVHRQYLWPAPIVAAMLREAGFRVAIRRGSGVVPLAPNVRAFRATRT